MIADDVHKRLGREPFEPIRVGLSDGRSVLILHPDQAVVSRRHLYVGFARVERSKHASTPRSGETLTHDWMPIDLVHIAAVEPANGAGRGRRTKRET